MFGIPKALRSLILSMARSPSNQVSGRSPGSASTSTAPRPETEKQKPVRSLTEAPSAQVAGVPQEPPPPRWQVFAAREWQQLASQQQHWAPTPGWTQIQQDPSLIMDTEPINTDTATMTEIDRARLAAHRAAKALFPTYGTEAIHYRGDVAPFKPRTQPDAWALSNNVLTVWRQACYFSPIGDKSDFFPVTVHFNQTGSLHSTKGPAITFSDGLKVYFIRGIEVGELAVMRPHEIPISMIRDCKNI